MKKQKLVMWGLFFVTIIVLSGCANQNELAGTVNGSGKIYGFWFGLLHGLIAPISLIVSLFNKGINIYEVHNTGAGYNIGFFLGIMSTVSSSIKGCKKAH